MTLMVDRRVGSGELAHYLEGLHLPVHVTDLGYGDMAWLGLGPEGEPIPVGVERKALSDFISSMVTGRLAGHQLPGLLQCYREVWVIVEGVWRPDPHSGLVLVPKGKKGWAPLQAGTGATGLMYRDLVHMFLTLEIKGGVRIARTASKLETCRMVAAMYTWWTAKSWEEHRSHLALSTTRADSAILGKVSVRRMVAAQLPGVGWTKSREIEGHFGSVLEMTLADPKEWEKVPGIGKTLAKRICGALRGE